MDAIVDFGLGMVGFLIGNLLFAKIGRWAVAIYEVTRDPGGGSKGGRLANVTLLSSGPWFAIAVGIFAYYAHAQTWVVPIFVGAVIAIGLFSAIGVYFAWKHRKRAKANAA
jgi:hypothetical protein